MQESKSEVSSSCKYCINVPLKSFTLKTHIIQYMIIKHNVEICPCVHEFQPYPKSFTSVVFQN